MINRSLEVPRESVINFLVNLSTLSVFTFTPIWGKELGLSNPDIALVATLYALVAFLSSIITGRLSDILATRKFFVMGGSITGGIALIGLLIPDKLFFMIFRVASGFGFGMLIPSLVALVSDKQNKIGSFSSFGSFGWALGVIISGILGLFWLPAIFIFGVLALVGASVISFHLVDEDPSNRQLIEENFVRIFWERKSAYLSLGIRHSFANSIWTFWPLFLVTLGANTFWIAIIQFINAFTQFIIMQKYTDRLKSQTMITLGLLLSALAFFTFTIPTDFWGIFPTQIVLGLSWAFLYVGTLRYSMEKTDYDKSTSAGFLTSTQAISGIFGSSIALFIISIGGSYIDIMNIATIATFLTLAGFILSNRRKNNN
ncbi:MAG: MFS transporter [Candidatus Hodarchaeales archaeon]